MKYLTQLCLVLFSLLIVACSSSTTAPAGNDSANLPAPTSEITSADNLETSESQEPTKISEPVSNGEVILNTPEPPPCSTSISRRCGCVGVV